MQFLAAITGFLTVGFGFSPFFILTTTSACIRFRLFDTGFIFCGLSNYSLCSNARVILGILRGLHLFLALLLSMFRSLFDLCFLANFRHRFGLNAVLFFFALLIKRILLENPDNQLHAAQWMDIMIQHLGFQLGAEDAMTIMLEDNKELLVNRVNAERVSNFVEFVRRHGKTTEARK